MGAETYACQRAGSTPQEPHVSQAERRRSGELHIIGKDEWRCTRSIDSFTIDMALQRETEDGWETVSEVTHQKIPPARGWEYRVVFPDCVTGTWRTKVALQR